MLIYNNAFRCLVLLAGALLAACSPASMRVDVEVYKGPLSKPISQQLAELQGVVSEAYKAINKGNRPSKTLKSYDDKNLFENRLEKDWSDAAGVLLLLDTHVSALGLSKGNLKNLGELRAELVKARVDYDYTKAYSRRALTALEQKVEQASVPLSTMEMLQTKSEQGEEVKRLFNEYQADLKSLESLKEQMPVLQEASKETPGYKAAWAEIDKVLGGQQARENRLTDLRNAFQASSVSAEDLAALNRSFDAYESVIVHASKLALALRQEPVALARVEYVERELEMWSDSAAVPPAADWLNETRLNKLREVLRRGARAATILKAKAATYPHPILEQDSIRDDTRQKTHGFIVSLAEYGNQISSRVDALALQLEVWQGLTGNAESKTIDSRKRIAHMLSAYLRDSQPTLFVDLPVWDERGPNNHGDRKGAAKGFKLLYGDHYWSCINSVHSSGRGNFKNVLVKDDIGNWTLKSYSNRPGELVDAYTKLTLASLKASAKLAAAVASGGTTEGVSSAMKGLKAARELTSSLTAGNIGEAAGGPDMDLSPLRQNIIMELEKLKAGELTDSSEVVQKVEYFLEQYDTQLDAMRRSLLLGSQARGEEDNGIVFTEGSQIATQ